MAFKFQFQSILDLKVRLEDLKKAEYGEAVHELQVQTEKLNFLIEERDLQFNLMQERLKGGLTPKEFITYNNYMKRLKKSIEIQNEVVNRAQNAAEKARLELVNAAKERKMFETLKEKKLEEYWDEYYKKEQLQLDEIASYRYNGGVKDGQKG